MREIHLVAHLFFNFPFNFLKSQFFTLCVEFHLSEEFSCDQSRKIFVPSLYVSPSQSRFSTSHSPDIVQILEQFQFWNNFETVLQWNFPVILVDYSLCIVCMFPFSIQNFNEPFSLFSLNFCFFHRLKNLTLIFRLIWNEGQLNGLQKRYWNAVVWEIEHQLWWHVSGVLDGWDIGRQIIRKNDPISLPSAKPETSHHSWHSRWYQASQFSLHNCGTIVHRLKILY